MRISLHGQAGAKFVSLARRCNTTPNLLGRHVIAQLLASARTGSLPEISESEICLEDPWHGLGGSLITLEKEEAAALKELADRLATTPAALAAFAAKQMLEAIHAGALPMIKPLKIQPEEKSEPCSVVAARLNQPSG